MPRLDIAFLTLAAAFLILGLSIGIAMGIAHDFRLAPVHAHLNLVGFVALSIFGLSYRTYPALGRSRLAVPHFLSSGLGALVFPLGIYIAISREFVGIAIGGSFLVLGGAALFLVNLVLNVALSSAPSLRAAPDSTLAGA